MRVPDTLPILPIKGSLLLPAGQINQKLFEIRYLNMIRDSLASQDRLIGVCIIDGSDNQRDNFFEVGCAGRITSFEELVDGSFLIVLTGYCRFKLRSEVTSMRQYRRFEIDILGFEDDVNVNPNSNIIREELIDLIIKYSNIHSIDMDWNLLDNTPNFNLVTFFAMHLPFSDKQRQTLLEAVTVEDRADVMSNIIKNHL